MPEFTISTRVAVSLIAGVLVVAAILLLGMWWFFGRGVAEPAPTPASPPPQFTEVQKTQALNTLSAPQAPGASSTAMQAPAANSQPAPAVSPEHQKALNNLSAPSSAQPAGASSDTSNASSTNSVQEQQILQSLQAH